MQFAKTVYKSTIFDLVSVLHCQAHNHLCLCEENSQFVWLVPIVSLKYLW